MARTFVDGSSHYLYNSGTPPVTAQPLTMACWFYPIGDFWNVLVGIGTAGSNNNRYSLGATNNANGSLVSAQSRSSINGIAQTTSGFTRNTAWYHACAVFTSNTSRAAYLNGGSKGTNSTNVSISTPSALYVGDNMGYVPNAVDGHIAEVAMWNVALTDAEVLQLAQGARTTDIRRDNLVLYVPILGDSTEYDFSGNGYNLTVANSPAVADHVPLGPQFGYDTLIPYTVTVGGTTIQASVSDGFEFTESLARTAKYSVSVTDGLNTGDSSTKIASFLTSLVDGIELSDFVAPSAIRQGLAGDGVTLSDSLSASATLQGTVDDGVILSDSLSTNVTLQGQAVDGMTFGDAVAATIVVGILAYASDGISFADLPQTEITKILGIADGLKLSDQSIATLFMLLSASDGVAFADSTTASIVTGIIQALAQDGISLTDTTQTNLRFGVTLSDGVKISDSVAAFFNIAVALSDGFIFSDLSFHVLAQGVIKVTFTLNEATIEFLIKEAGIDFDLCS